MARTEFEIEAIPGTHVNLSVSLSISIGDENVLQPNSLALEDP
jgi:hypothetical protein